MTEHCRDCGKEFPIKLTAEWCEGDSYIQCNECVKLEEEQRMAEYQHREAVRKVRQEAAKKRLESYTWIKRIS